MATEVGNPRILLPPRIARDAVIHVRAQLTHPMFTGMGRDPNGKTIPAYFVQEVVVSYGDEQVARFEWSSGVSRDPFVDFPLRASKEAPLTIVWKDNKGGVYRQTADVKFS